ncbi:MAG TPA: hypothetical protein VF834_07760 [Streptosporangiaceae bacterium]
MVEDVVALGGPERPRGFRRRRQILGGLVLVVIALLAGARLLGGGPAGHPARRASGPDRTVALPPEYPGAVVARIPVSGVISLTSDGTRAWAVTETGPPSDPYTSYQLVGIDLRLNRVVLRIGLGRQSPAVAAGGGTVWVTAPYRPGRPQLERIDPATGHVVALLHLPAGPCTYLTYSAGQFYASCLIRMPNVSELFRFGPVASRASWRSGHLAAQIGPAAVAPHALWWVVGYSMVQGIALDGRRHALLAPAPWYQPAYSGNVSLAYGEGSMWEFTPGESESVLRFDPGTGKVTRVYHSRGYDPASTGGLDFLTFGSGSLWFLDDGYPFSGVLRVSVATGRLLGGVPVPAGSCGQQPCSQIYATAGAVWVPALGYLLRIDPGRMPR